MSNFEKITASLETLGDFLASLMAVDTPWEDAFHKTFCTECGRDNCDEKCCPFQKERDNPTWWLFQAAEGEQEAANDSEREFLIREYERRLARLKNGASSCGVIFRNGRTELEPEMVVPIQDEERHADGTCNAFNVYLNGKGPDGKVLCSVERVILPAVTTRRGNLDKPMVAELVFGRIEDAAELIANMGGRCRLEIRAAIQNWNQTNAEWEFNGHRYILEGAPVEIEQEEIEKRSRAGLTVRFLAHHYTAAVEEKELWDFRYWED